MRTLRIIVTIMILIEYGLILYDVYNLTKVENYDRWSFIYLTFMNLGAIACIWR